MPRNNALKSIKNTFSYMEISNFRIRCRDFLVEISFFQIHKYIIYGNLHEKRLVMVN